jgi:DNA-binding beta-propeller fold protein YncE
LWFISCLLGQVSTLVGSSISGSTDGVGTNAKFKNPYGVAVNPSNTLLYVIDYDNHNIRLVNLLSGNMRK